MSLDKEIINLLTTRGISVGQPLGEGGEAPVFRAQRQLSSGTRKLDCAVKVYRFLDDVHELPDSLDQQFEAMHRLNGSPHFLQLWDIIHDKRFVAVVMELGDQSLEGVLSEHDEGLPRKDCFAYMEQVAHGVSEAHGFEQPLYHGDLKPDNMLLCRNVVKICDFGTAAIAHTKTTMISRGHTPAYLLPGHEMKLTLERDFFAFAVSYARLRLGRRPFASAAGIPDGRPDLAGMDADEIEFLRPVLMGSIPQINVYQWFIQLNPDKRRRQLDVSMNVSFARMLLERVTQRRTAIGFHPTERDFEELAAASQLVQQYLDETPDCVEAYVAMARIHDERANLLDVHGDDDHKEWCGRKLKIPEFLDLAISAMDKAIAYRADTAEHFAYRAELRIRSWLFAGNEENVPCLLRANAKIFDVPNWFPYSHAFEIAKSVSEHVLEDVAKSVSLKATPAALSWSARLKIASIISDCLDFPSDLMHDEEWQGFKGTFLPEGEPRIAEAIRDLTRAIDMVLPNDPLMRANLLIQQSWINAGIDLCDTSLFGPVRIGKAICDLDEAEEQLCDFWCESGLEISEHDRSIVAKLISVIKRNRGEHCLRLGLGMTHEQSTRIVSEEFKDCESEQGHRHRLRDELNLQWSESLPRNSATITIREMKTLSVAEAKWLAIGPWDNLELNEVTSLSAEAAEALASFRGAIFLNGIDFLTPEVAYGFANHQSQIAFGGLTSLSIEVAEALAEHLGGIVLDGLRILTPDVARLLAEHEGGFLCLNGIDTMSLEVAEAFAKHEGHLYLNGLKTLSREAREALDRHQGQLWGLFLVDTVRAKPREVLKGGMGAGAGPLFSLGLGSHPEEQDFEWDEPSDFWERKELRFDYKEIERLSVAEARRLISLITERFSAGVGSLWDALDLSGLTDLTESVARELAEYPGALILNRIASEVLTFEVASALALHGGELTLDGLASLSPDVAEALSEHSGGLILDGVKTLSPAVAKALAGGNCRFIYLSNLDYDSMSSEVWEALLQNPFIQFQSFGCSAYVSFMDRY